MKELSLRAQPSGLEMETTGSQNVIQQSRRLRPTTDHARRADRNAKRKAYQALVRSIVDVDVFSPTPRSIFECLSKARLTEDSASSAALSRQELSREAPEAAVPDELSETAVSAQLARAANLYAVAAAKYVRIPDLSQAFRYFRRAARIFAKAAESPTPMRAQWLEAAQTYTIWTDRVRQEHARRCLCRRRLSLGLVRRQR